MSITDSSVTVLIQIYGKNLKILSQILVLISVQQVRVRTELLRWRGDRWLSKYEHDWRFDRVRCRVGVREA